MRLQVLSSGSRGNSTLVRAGELTLMVDAGLTAREMRARMEAARLGPRALDHLFVTHGHLDHARSAGILGRREDARVHCSESVMSNASLRRAPDLAAITIGSPTELAGEGAEGPIRVTPVAIPHDAVPTVAYRIEHADRCAVILTDMGKPSAEVARRLQGAHLLVLEFNHDLDLLESGPYPAPLKRRIRGDGGHLSNDQASSMLHRLAGEELHTLVLAHLSEQNNEPERAREQALGTLASLGLGHVEVLVASQDHVGPDLRV